jgi:outer membrane lipoprotein-sorting protein
MKSALPFICLMALATIGSPTLLAQDKPEAAAAAKEVLPSGESVLDKYIESIGGKEAFKKVKNAVFKGSLSFMGASGSVTIYRAAPNLFVMETEHPMMGKVLQGFDGKNGWVVRSGPEVYSDKDTNDLKNQNVFTEDWRSIYSTAETVGLETIDGEECYKVAVTPKAGGAQTNYYSKKSGLLLGSDMPAEGGGVARFANKDYRKVGDVLLPFQTVISQGDISLVMTFSEIKINADLPPTAFDPPAEVKALLNK